MSLQIVLGENSSSIKVGGKEYFLSPLTLGDIAAAEEKIGCDLDGFEKELKKVRNLLFLVYLSLRRKNKDITVEQVGDMFEVQDLEELGKILDTVLQLSGMAAKSKKAQGTASVVGQEAAS